MSKTHKIIWAEGILLSQQHFQQWEIYHQQQNRYLLHALRSHAWGLCELVIDEDMLSSGILLIKKCKVIFQSGILIKYDATIDAPLCYHLNAVESQNKEIYLCLPLGQKVSNITGYHQSDQINTWLADYKIISDLYDHSREHEVLFAKPNLMLLSNEDNLSHFESIKIAEIVKCGREQYKLSENYMPPAFIMQGSHLLCHWCMKWLAYLRSNEQVLRENYQQLTDKMSENDQLVFTHLILLQAVRNARILLQHYVDISTVHPEQLYIIFANLVCSLSLFDHQYDITAVPCYSHTKLFDVFNILQQDIKVLLEKAIPSSVSVIMLRKIENTLYIVENIDPKYFNQYNFYLAIKQEINTAQKINNVLNDSLKRNNQITDKSFSYAIDDQNSNNKYWAEQIQHQIKLSAYSMIKQITASAVSGVKVIHTQRLPLTFSIKPGFEYFYIHQSGEAWDLIKKERSLALFIPYILTDAIVELITIAEK